MKNLTKNQTIKFRHISELTGAEIVLVGTIVGFGPAVRYKWPDELAEAPDEIMLVWRQDAFGNDGHYAVLPEDVVNDMDEEENGPLSHSEPVAAEDKE